MQINLKNRKYSLKLIASIIWIAFLLAFWNDTCILLADNYQFFHQQKTPFLANIAAYGIWCLTFIIPNLFWFFYVNSIAITFVKPKAIWLLEEPSYFLILKSTIRGFCYLLIPLFIMSMMFHFGSEHGGSTLEGFTPMFRDSLTHSSSQIIHIEQLHSIYNLAMIMPFAFAMILPQIFLMLVTFALEFPLLSSAIIISSILYSFWQKFEARKYFEKLDLKDNSAPVELTDKEYELLAEAIGGEEKLRKGLEIIRKIKDRQ